MSFGNEREFIDYLQVKEGIDKFPDNIECPYCGKEITDIDVKEEGHRLYFDGQRWVWRDPQNVSLYYYCSECGEELPITAELELIVESAE